MFLLLFAFIFSQSATPPLIPQILGVGGNGYVTITWDRAAESSIDAQSGYADFEGYRLYRSTDGGITWGLESDIIPRDGQIVGWNPIKQFDLDDEEDIERCIYLNGYDDDCINIDNDCDEIDDDGLPYYDNETSCTNIDGCFWSENTCQDIDESLKRSVDIEGADPVAPWFSLGKNTKLRHSYIDTDVINGKEYTYAITAYDMGVRIDTVSINESNGLVTLDTTWSASNPGQFTCPSGWGKDGDDLKYNQCPSFESPKFSESFTDYNANGTWDMLTDNNNNGLCDGNDICEPWDDEDLDGIWDSLRMKEDINGDGNIDMFDASGLINVVTITPSNNASDVSFPDTQDTETFIIAGDSNVGTGYNTYRFIDEDSLDPSLIKIEIQADRNYATDEGLHDGNDFEDYSSRNPSLYIYGINEDGTVDLGRAIEYCEGTTSGIFSTCDGTSDSNISLSELLNKPGAAYNDDNTRILVPRYYIEEHPIEFTSLDPANTYFKNNFTDWFNGVQFRFDNYWAEEPLDGYVGIDTIQFYDAAGNYNEKLDSVFTPISFGNFEIPSGDITLSFWSDGFESRPMFDYKIEFQGSEEFYSTIEDPVDTSRKMFSLTDDEFCLNMSNFAPYWDSDDNPYYRDDFVSFLPFKITNITTDRQVRVYHNDEGIYYHGDVTGDLIGISQADVPGYSDCVWQPNENIAFAYDMIAYSTDLTDIEDQKTYNLRLNYDFSAVREKYGQELVVDDDGFPYYDLFDFWNLEFTDDGIVVVEKDYSKGDIVEVLRIVNFGGELITTGVSGIFKASREIINSEEVYPNICGGICPPNAVYDNNGDGLNDSPWEQLYPWDDGDYVIISPEKWYNDGDYWTVDLSRIGQKEDLTSTLMDSIIVVPNPYVVNSLYNEEIYGNRLLFDKLPKQCTIDIYTVTGEFVNTISHGGSSNLSGSEPWDLKNENGNLVHPGLYFYVVQATGVPDKMGKFVIIR